MKPRAGRSTPLGLGAGGISRNRIGTRSFVVHHLLVVVHVPFVTTFCPHCVAEPTVPLPTPGTYLVERLEVQSMPARNAITMLDESGEVVVDDRPMPDPGEGELLIDVEASLVSPGTETSMIGNRRENPGAGDPFALGYQAAGVVAETGPGVDEFSPGDRVACMGSGYAHHAEFDVVPQNLCVELPDGVSFEEGAFCHLSATSLHGVRQADVALGEYGVVLGLGVVGQLTAQLAQLAGCHVLGTDLFDRRVETADRLGVERTAAADGDLADVAPAFTNGHGVDCGFLCFGGDATEAFWDLQKTMVEAPDGHRMGRVVVLGGVEMDLDFPASMGHVDIRNAARTGPGYHDPSWERGDRYPAGFVKWDTRRNIEEALGRIDAGELRVEELITDRYSLDDAADAYDQLLTRPEESIGIVIEP